MRKSRILKSTLSHMLVSYVGIVVILVFAIGITSGFLFSNSFRKEIVTHNEKMMERIQDTLNSRIFQNVENIAYSIYQEDICGPESVHLFENSGVRNYSAITNIYQDISEKANFYPDLIDAIHVFYADNNMCISTKYGFKDFAVSDDFGLKQFFTQINYSNTFSGFWILDPAISIQNSFSSEQDYIYYAFTYPRVYQEQTFKGAFVVSVKLSAILDTIQNIFPDSPNRVFLVTDSTPILSYPSHSQFPEELSEVLNQGILYQQNQSSFSEKDSTLFSALFPRPNCLLINIIPTNYFFRTQIQTQIIVLSISLLILFLGVFWAYLLVVRLYSPIRVLATRTRRLLNGTGPVNENEFHYISTAIDQLSNQITDMNQLIQNNKTAITQDILNTLLHGGVWKDCLERIQMIRPEIQEENCSVCAVILVNIREKNFRTLSIEQREYLCYNIIRYMEDLSEERHHILCARESENQFIAVCFAAFDAADFLCICSKTLRKYLSDAYSLKISAAIGSEQIYPGNLEKSLENARQLAEYFFYDVSTFPLMNEEMESKVSQDIPDMDVIIVRFSKALPTRDIEEMRKVLLEITTICTSHQYPAAKYHYFLLSLLHTFSKYVGDYGKKSDFDNSLLYQQFLAMEDILEFQEWFEHYIQEFWNYLDHKEQQKHQVLVQAICKYITEHLASDISLDIIGEQTGMAPQYVSRIFKMETGKSILDYVTILRLKQACILLCETNDSVETICMKTGFHNVPYFIRKFKETYGCTPGNYRKEFKLKKM
ncbi:MAG: helix-turn-helix transcriptional regulator [Candidatus Merdivicinus sp.]|jgi:two-component system response regulator YesN